MSSTETAPRWAILTAFAALYLIWGSTYLGIKIAIETMPPFLMASSRFFLAGLVLYGLARWRGEKRPTLQDWKGAFIVGSLLIAGGNGLVTYAERWIDSSMAALVLASNPLVMTLLGWWGGVQERPGARAWFSLVGGFLGVALLIVSGNEIAAGQSVLGYALLLFAVISWALGSVYSKRNPQKISLWMQSGMQMCCGGLVCLLVGGLMGEFDGFELAKVSSRSWVAYGYLFLLGSLAGFTSYVYLLKHCSPSAVSSHAYVNPVVAVILGWLILQETLTPTGIVGSCLIVVSVYILLTSQKS